MKYLGFKTGEELYRIMLRQQSVFARLNGMKTARTLLWIGTLGTPVVGSKMGGIPELIELVKPESCLKRVMWKN